MYVHSIPQVDNNATTIFIISPFFINEEKFNHILLQYYILFASSQCLIQLDSNYHLSLAPHNRWYIHKKSME